MVVRLHHPAQRRGESPIGPRNKWGSRWKEFLPATVEEQDDLIDSLWSAATIDDMGGWWPCGYKLYSEPHGEQLGGRSSNYSKPKLIIRARPKPKPVVDHQKNRVTRSVFNYIEQEKLAAGAIDAQDVFAAMARTIFERDACGFDYGVWWLGQLIPEHSHDLRLADELRAAINRVFYGGKT